MRTRVNIAKLRLRCRHLRLYALLAILGSLSNAEAYGKDAPARLLDRQPFDRITLATSAGGEAIDVLLLDLPNRRVPNPLPNEGSLELRRLSEPSALYTVDWESIAKIELFEQLLLAEAVKLTREKNLDEAYDYLGFLYKNYVDLPGLGQATEQYLRQDALATYAEKRFEETLTVLMSLYDQNPQHRGLVNFVETVTDRLINAELAERNFAAARGVLDTVEGGFPRLRPDNIASWQAKFERGAARQLSSARQAIDEGDFRAARQAVRRALAILPEAAGADELLTEIDLKSPLIVIGVDRLIDAAQSDVNTLFWSHARVAQLVQPRLLELVGFGAEGGDYKSPWMELSSDDTGLELDVQLTSAAISRGLTASNLALAFLRQADPAQPQFRADFAGLLRSVSTADGNRVNLRWRRSHVRPEALLPVHLDVLTAAAIPPGAYLQSFDAEAPQIALFELPDEEGPRQGPKTLVEKRYEEDEAAVADLARGEIDVLARVPPWQVDRLERTEGIAVSSYRLPAIHVLLPNYEVPILRRREFRRAICYGIDRPQILRDIVLGGVERSGFRVLSGPLPAGLTITDPVGYAYNQALQPRPYEPRLAAVLATVARNSLAKQQAAMRGEQVESEVEAGEPAAEADEAPVVEPLVLAHPPHPVATSVCQSLKLQLGAVGIPIKLQSLPMSPNDGPPAYDLQYAELALWEPIVDARRLLGPHGLAGNCSSSMSLALRDVDEAKNWKEARSRLQDVHQIAFNDLQVIPLWQTVEFFAHRQSLRGVGENPVTLYQNVADWRRERGGGSR